MERDLSAKKVFQLNDDMPEFGAGSEYGRKQKIQVLSCFNLKKSFLVTFYYF